ncbi:FecR family protein [Microbulbifer harenosus]|uniref:DUF4880 domain-containing protein n=1 Tax=Microbulbifer harenosus TaxID=2576840 RepID=A0ABY2UGF5_9GAMM|nr:MULTISPECIES: FecR domain-containing protein [Microbulbifer]QIL91644.1 DUF4880 domain-containing protein [Microbulbifer sp. SH-1]TLM76754.1 DUF4880 domain-containing protein [Microbulbifer harenosus]
MSPVTDAYQEAAYWLELLSEGEPDPVTARRFENWLKADRQHAVIFERMVNTWDSPILQEALTSSAPTDDDRRGGTNHPLARWLMPMAAAACLLLALWQFPFREHQPPYTAHFETPAMQPRQLSLADGSRLQLDAASIVDVRLDATARRIELRQGAAYFDVAHDASRPFEVGIGDARVTALGTEFNIESSSYGIDVTVHEGRVEVRTRAPEEPVILSAGQRVRISSVGIEAAEAVALDDLLDWRQGWVEIRDRPLPYLLERLSRYSPAPIVAEGELAQLPIAGRFRLAETNENLALLARLYGLSVSRSPDRIELRRAVD